MKIKEYISYKVNKEINERLNEQDEKSYYKNNIDYKNKVKSIDNQLNKLHDELVPDEGISETVEGEMIRAITRLIYRYYNDGDYYFKEYGKETAGKSADYLKFKTPISHKLKGLLIAAKETISREDDEYTEKDGYSYYLYETAKEIIKYVNSKLNDLTPNTYDSR